LFEFPPTKSAKNQYLSHLRSENREINSTKSNLSKAFQKHQERLQISIKFTVLILFNFY
jgi:hypothetical protein